MRFSAVRLLPCCFAILVFCPTANAEADEIFVHLGATIAFTEPLVPLDGSFYIRDDLSAGDLLTTWPIAGITLADLGVVHTLSESEAAGVGFDWALMESVVLGDNPLTLVGQMDFGRSIITWQQLHNHYDFDDVSQLEFELVNYEVLPPGSWFECCTAHSYQFYFRISGPGRAVPEPTSAVLWCCGLLFAVGGQIRGRRPPVRPLR